ncbi:DMT family transporter [Candidatus Bathyarchaeota archaeon]|nr:DMT family transporter [Candidatus Bathyarchaeota archaeon]
MLAELAALIASVTTALATILVTKGMKYSNPDTGNLVMTGVQTIILTVLLLMDLPPLDLTAILWFAVTGVFSSFIGRMLALISYQRMGVSVGSSLTGTTPVITTMLAILFLGEPFIASVVLGAVLVVAGVVILNMSRGKQAVNISEVYIPLAAAAFFAVSNVFRKLGTNIQPHAVLGAQVGTLSGFLVFAFYLFLKGGLRGLNVNRGNFSWLTGAGVLNAVAWITLTMAVSLGDVSVVSPILYSYPLFSILFSRIMLRDEPITMYTVAGSVTVFLGVIAVLLI